MWHTDRQSKDYSESASNRRRRRTTKTPSGNAVSTQVNKIKSFFEISKREEQQQQNTQIGDGIVTLNSLNSHSPSNITLPKIISQPEKQQQSESVKAFPEQTESLALKCSQPNRRKQTSAVLKLKIKATPTREDTEAESDNYFTPPNTPKSKQPLIAQEFKRIGSAMEEINSDQPSKEAEATQECNTEVGHETGISEMETAQGDLSFKVQEDLIPAASMKPFEMRLMHEGFKRLEKKVDALTQNISSEVKKGISDLKNEIDEEEVKRGKALQELQEKVSRLELQNAHQVNKMKALSGTVQHVYEMIQDLSNKMEKVELNTTRRQLTLTGLQVENKKEEIIAEVTAFIEYYMGLRVTVEDAYTLGTAEPPQIVFVLQSLQEKHEILQNRSKLKGAKNFFNKSYFINDYFPMETSERKRRERQIIKFNEDKDEDQQQEIEFVKGKLTIDGWQYTKKNP